MRTLGYLPFPLRIDALVVEYQGQQRQDTRYDEPEFKGMTKKIPWRILRTIEVGSHGW
jgi:hypothetical protein